MHAGIVNLTANRFWRSFRLKAAINFETSVVHTRSRTRHAVELQQCVAVIAEVGESFESWLSHVRVELVALEELAGLALILKWRFGRCDEILRQSRTTPRPSVRRWMGCLSDNTSGTYHFHVHVCLRSRENAFAVV